MELNTNYVQRIRIDLAIFLFAFVLRIIYLFEIKNNPALWLLLGDAQSYSLWAQEISSGSWIGNTVFTQAPLYPYFLAVIYRIFGQNIIIVRVMQIILGSLSCVLIVKAGEYFHSRKVGIVAGCFWALYPTAIFFDGLIQKASLGSFVMALLLCLLGKVTLHKKTTDLFFVGIVLGLFGLVRENSFIFIFVILFWMLFFFKKNPFSKRLQQYMALFLGLIIILFPVALRNKILGGSFLVSTPNVGLNFYIGNHANATGTYSPLIYGHGDAQYEYDDSVRLAEAVEGRKLLPSEVSHFWVKKTFSDIHADYGKWGRLMLKKVLLVFNAVEIGDTEDQYTYAQSSRVLSISGIVFHFGILFPLAVWGICLGGRDRRLWLLYLMLGFYVLAVSFFYVFSRYRFPIVPILTLLASIGLCETLYVFRRKQTKKIFISLLIVVMSILILNIRIVSKDRVQAGTNYNIGFHYHQEGSFSLAQQYYKQSLEHNPGNERTLNNLGDVMRRLQKYDEAIICFKKALAIDPKHFFALNNLGTTYCEMGQQDEALKYYLQSISISPHHAKTYYALANLWAKQNNFQGAIQNYRQALKINPEYANAHNNLGNLLLKMGDTKAALSHYQKALQINPHHKQAERNILILEKSDHK